MFVSKQLSESKEVEPESDQAEDGMETVEEEEGSMDVDVGNTSADVLEMSFCESLRVRTDWPCTVGCIDLHLHVSREITSWLHHCVSPERTDSCAKPRGWVYLL